MLTKEKRDDLEQELCHLQGVAVLMELLTDDYPCINESPERMRRLLLGLDHINGELQEISKAMQKAFDRELHELATEEKTAAGTAVE